MPCRDFYDDHPQAYYGPMLKDKDQEIARLKKQISFAESALCAVMRAIEAQENDELKNPVWAYIDFNAAGITGEELVNWFIKHKALDDKHRAEAAKKAEAAKRAAEVEAAAEAMARELAAKLPAEVVNALKGKL